MNDEYYVERQIQWWVSSTTQAVQILMGAFLIGIILRLSWIGQTRHVRFFQLPDVCSIQGSCIPIENVSSVVIDKTRIRFEEVFLNLAADAPCPCIHHYYSNAPCICHLRLSNDQNVPICKPERVGFVVNPGCRKQKKFKLLNEEDMKRYDEILKYIGSNGPPH